MSELRKLFLTDGEGGAYLAKVNSEGQLHVVLMGKIDTSNSTDVPLGPGEVFTGDWVSTLDYGAILTVVNTDQASTTAGLEIQWSTDGVNVDAYDHYTVLGNSGVPYNHQPVAVYFRLKYTNGPIAQTYLRLQTTLRKTAVRGSTHRIGDDISCEDDAELVKAVITGKKPDGDFTNFTSTPRGNFKTSIEEYGDTSSIDAFNRLRVSTPYTLFDSKQLHDKQPLFWSESLGGSATSNHNSTNACTEMSVTASASDFVIRQTKQRFNYQPGKSQLALMTFYASQTAGITKRVGLFDGTGVDYLTPLNGIFYETNSSISWNIAKNGTTTESVTQANWNVDTLDGSGDENNPSGITLDTSGTQILIIDYEWLGVGRVRVGFIIDGVIKYVHYFNHSNDSSYSSVYMSTPNLPLRYDIQSDGTASDQLDHICSTVVSEGGLEETGILRSVDTGTTHINASTADTTYAVVGIKLKSAYKDVTVLPEFFSVINQTPQDYRWSLCLNPTIAGTFTYTDLTNSAVQRAIGTSTNTVSDEGLVIDSGYVTASNQVGGSVDRKFVTSLKIGSSIAGVQDELVLCVTPLDSNSDILGSLTFRELL